MRSYLTLAMLPWYPTTTGQTVRPPEICTDEAEKPTSASDHVTDLLESVEYCFMGSHCDVLGSNDENGAAFL